MPRKSSKGETEPILSQVTIPVMGFSVGSYEREVEGTVQIFAVENQKVWLRMSKTRIIFSFKSSDVETVENNFLSAPHFIFMSINRIFAYDAPSIDSFVEKRDNFLTEQEQVKLLLKVSSEIKNSPETIEDYKLLVKHHLNFEKKSKGPRVVFPVKQLGQQSNDGPTVRRSLSTSASPVINNELAASVRRRSMELSLSHEPENRPRVLVREGLVALSNVRQIEMIEENGNNDQRRSDADWLKLNRRHDQTLGMIGRLQDERDQLRSEIERLNMQLSNSVRTTRTQLYSPPTEGETCPPYEFNESAFRPPWSIGLNDIIVTSDTINQGSYGAVRVGVYKGTRVAVNVRQDLTVSHRNRDVFNKETSLAYKCRHPCLVLFIGSLFDEDDETPMFVSELIDVDLRLVLTKKPLRVKDNGSISLDIACALSYLHNLDPPIIHRNLTTSNIYVWREPDGWRAKVGEYCFANFLAVSEEESERNRGQMRGNDIDEKVDIYSFGVILSELWNRLPSSPPSSKNQNQNDVMVAKQYRHMIVKCLDRDPDNRPEASFLLSTFSALLL